MKVGMMFGVSCECAQHIYVPYVANYSRWKTNAVCRIEL